MNDTGLVCSRVLRRILKQVSLQDENGEEMAMMAVAMGFVTQVKSYAAGGCCSARRRRNKPCSLIRNASIGPG